MTLLAFALALQASELPPTGTPAFAAACAAAAQAMAARANGPNADKDVETAGFWGARLTELVPDARARKALTTDAKREVDDAAFAVDDYVGGTRLIGRRLGFCQNERLEPSDGR